MKVFISWSGDRSLAIAKTLSNWLPRVIQSVEPWISSRDIDAGARWREQIDDQLLGNCGILCMVPDNLSAPWIHYEAGALSKTVVEKARVIPYLTGLRVSDLNSPLADFNACEATPEGTLKLLKSLNKGAFPKLSPEILRDAFDKQWSTLDASLKEISNGFTKVPEKTQHELVEQLISLVRSSQDSLDSFREELLNGLFLGVRPTGFLGTAVPAISGSPVSTTPQHSVESISEPKTGDGTTQH